MSRSPRRAAPALFGAGLATAAALAFLPVTAASTASVHVPATISGHVEVHATGGVLMSVSHTMAADGTTIVDSMLTLRGKLIQLWIYVRVGDGNWVRCLRHGWAIPPGQNDHEFVSLFRCTDLNAPGENADFWVDARAR